ncbi:MAG TPA: amino acid adenylation domain-containing protein [Ktedonobacteraceae bacterium]
MSEQTEEQGIYSISQARDELLALLVQEEELSEQERQLPTGSAIQTGSEPLSFAQRRLWFFEQREPGNPVYNLPCAFRLRGSLQIEILKKSIEQIIQRHASLRTTFRAVDGIPQQSIAEECTFQLPQEDLHDLAGEQQQEAVWQYASSVARQAFDLQRGPLLRGRLLLLGPDHHMLLLVFHHSIFDGWSRELFLRELGAFYEAYLAGTTPRLVELPLQYTDFARWQQHYLDEVQTQTRLQEYWQQQLGGLSVLELPTDWPRPARQTYSGTTHSFTVPRAVYDALQTISRREGATLFMTLLAAFQVLLYRYTRQDDLVVGTPIANRNRAEWEHLIGFFVNMLVIRTRIEADSDFLGLLRQVRETTLDAYAHQDQPFERLVELLRPQRDASYSPLFQVVCILQNLPDPQWSFGNLTATAIKVPLGVSKVDLTLELLETEGDLRGSFEYNTALFDASTIQRLARHWLTLLESIVQNPRQSLCSLPMLSHAELQQILYDWNAPTAEPLPGQLFHQLFSEQAKQTPDAVALLADQGVVTYQALEDYSNQLARYLRAQGVTTESSVGVCLERTPEVIISILGILKAGGCYVPLDPATPRERLAYMLQAAGVQVLLTRQTMLAEFSAWVSVSIALDTRWPDIMRESRQPVEDHVELYHLAYIIFTSGTTGRPKGVLLEHRGLINLAMAQNSIFEVGPECRVLQFASLGFDVSIWEVAMTLLRGSSLYFCSSQERLDAACLHRALREQAITHISLTPSTLAVLPADNLPDLRVVISGGEVLTPALAERWASKYHLFNVYGPTEATVCATIGACQVGEPVTIGRPIPHTQIYLLDPNLQLVPAGVPGEIYIAGVGLARGYLGGADERFLFHSFSSQHHERLYRTGDLARYTTAGAIEYLGRVDQQVKIRGFRVEPGEIESLLLQHPSVAQCLVHAHTRAPGDIVLLAYIVPCAVQTPSEAGLSSELRSYLQDKVSGYMLPSDFIYLQRLPLNAHGKVDHRALPVPALRERDQSSATAYIPPQTPLERIIAECWQEALHMDQISLHDNFFDLGGHSLLTIQIQQRLQQTLERQIDLVDLFTYTTISALAQALGPSPNTLNTVHRARSKREEQVTQMRKQRLLRVQSRTIKE